MLEQHSTSRTIAISETLQRSSAAASRSASGSSQPRKILVVEDSKLLQKGYDLILRPYKDTGCQVVQAYDGREGMSLLNEHRDCELIILDVNIPGMPGIELLKRCKASTAFRHIPIILISTEGSEELILSSLRAGAAAFMVKPFSVSELHVLIEMVLRSKGSGSHRAA